MAHEITTSDNVVLTGTPAWHGLGIVVEHAPTPSQALRIAGLDWSVAAWPLLASNGGQTIAVPKTVANVRTDTSQILGIVSTGYKPVQNAELAEFCALLASEDDTVKVESAGSIRGGERVWFLLRGESFAVRGEDQMMPYILVSNGHDGKTAVRCTPTSVRVVCSNTLHMVIPRGDHDGLDRSARGFASFAHSGDVRQKVEQARAALGLYGRTLAANREYITSLAAKDLDPAAVKAFLVDCYARLVGPIPINPKTEAETAVRDRALDGVARMLARHDLESQAYGSTAWIAVNAVTHYLQHERTNVRSQAGRDRAIQSALFGTTGDRSRQAYELALAL